MRRPRTATPHLVLAVVLAALVLAGCTGAGETAGSTTGTTPSASSSADAPPADPTAEPATVRGAICYPSEEIPAMTAFFEETTTGRVTTLDVAAGQSTYEVELEPGTYLAFAYLVDPPTLGGAYTAAVPCGLDVTCTDHTPLPVTVEAGETLEDIDLCDWYDQAALPPNPTP